MHNRETLSVTRVRAVAWGVALAAACASCAATGPSTPPTSPPTDAPSPPPGTRTPRPSDGGESPDPSADISELRWYEASRVIGPGGAEERTLYIGSLGGELVAAIELGTSERAQRAGLTESFAWAFPQTAGIFGDSVLIWERQDGTAAIEAVSIQDGSARPVLDTDDSVHVATADRGFQRVFFVTADAISGLPNGLWVDDLGDDAGPAPIDYPFADRPLSNAYKYRLATNADGSLLAIQAEDERITIVHVESGQSADVDPGGPMIGFAQERLVAYGPKTDTTPPSLVLVDPITRAERVVVDAVDAAQLVNGSDGDLVAFMQINDDVPAAYAIGVISPASGERDIAYTHDGPSVGPLLARRDRTPLGSQVPTDSVLLADTFLPFIEGLARPPDQQAAESYPILLNLLTRETQRIGPFGP
jgi:hypothetical protein